MNILSKLMPSCIQFRVICVIWVEIIMKIYNDANALKIEERYKI